MQALAKVRLSATPSNIRALLSIGKPTVDELLVAKGLCILLHVGKQQHGNRTESIISIEEADDRYWQQLKSIVQQKDSFYSRLHHYFFHKEAVSLAAKATVQGASMTCFECVKSNDDTGDTSSLLLHSIKNWMGVVLASAVGHKQEGELVQLESSERSILERNKIDQEVLTSSRSILRKEIDETNSDIAFDTEVVAQIKRKLHLSKCMKYITSGGHTVLSWAMSNGNESIVKQVLKTGAHTGIGEEVIVLCAVIIQMGYRRHLMRKAFVKLHPERISRERRFEHRSQCMAIAMRISSLHRIVKRRFGDIHLPLAQALFNGHSSLVKIFREFKREDDLSLFHAINLAPMFRVPGICIPRISSDALPWKDSNLMSLVLPCVQFQHERDPKSCTFVTSLLCTIELIDEHLMLQRRALEAKIIARRESLLHKHRQKMRTELKSAMRAVNFADMIKISNDGVSLDYEDDFGWTPLMLASVRDESLEHKQDLRLNGKPVSAVAFLLDRITPYKPTLSFESRLGLTALSVACTHDRLQAVSELLVRGSPINQQSVLTGKSALMLACEVGKINAAKLLVRHGADVNLKDQQGCTAIELATQNRHYEVSDYLQQLRVT
jgi:ankyrin repeat protein